MENIKTDEILKLILSQWKRLLFVAIIAVLVSIFVSSSYVLTPLYKSYAVVYPVNLSPSSEESNTEQLLQWFNSEEVKKELAKKFDLYTHYDIDTLDPKHETYFNLKYKEFVTIDATLYESIEIRVKDKSPILAQKLVQGIIDETNALIMNVKKERLNEYIENNQNEFRRAALKVDSIKTMIDDIRKEYNIIDIQYQSKYMSKEASEKTNLSESNTKTAEGLKTKRTELDRLSNVIGSQIGTYNYFRNQIDNYLLDYNNHVSFTNVVSKPTLPDSKCYPIRSLVTAVITLSSLLIACIFIVFSHFRKKD